MNSFTADTPVLMADGKEEPIADVKVGDKVLATDPESGRTEARPVTALIRHSGKHTMVDLTLDDGSKITTTDHHPFWDATTRTFTDAIDLRVGDRVLSDHGRTLAISVEHVYDQDLTAYNLQIDGIHTYYAGSTPVLVHNSCGSLDDALATEHGQARLAERGFDSIDIAIVKSSPTAYEQADGAIAHVGQLGENSYNVVVNGENGIVTGMRGLTRSELNNLARNYGWTDIHEADVRREGRRRVCLPSADHRTRRSPSDSALRGSARQGRHQP